MRTKSRLISVLFSVSTLLGCQPEPVPQPAPLPVISTFTVAKQQLDERISFPAVAAAADKATLAFRVPGEIQAINVKAGDRIAQGQVLARLEPTDYRLAVENASARFDVANSQYRRSAPLVEKGMLASRNLMS